MGSALCVQDNCFRVEVRLLGSHVTLVKGTALAPDGWVQVPAPSYLRCGTWSLASHLQVGAGNPYLTGY